MADQIFGDQSAHASVRAAAVALLRRHPERYEGFAVTLDGESFEGYLDRMGRDATWGDNLSLQAIADAFGMDINLVTNFASKRFVSVKCRQEETERGVHGAIWLAFYAEVHYTSIAPSGS
jgi:hypothetical protein